MITTPLFSSILVLIGAFFMLGAIVTSIRATPDVPAPYKNKWFILVTLMGLFLVGYLAVILVELLSLPLPVDVIAGSVFLGGACFVLLIISLSKSIIHSLRQREHLLEEARDQLEERVCERTQNLEQALAKLEKETKEHRQLSTNFEALNVELLQILNSSADGIRIIDKDFIVRRVNKTFVKMMGFDQEELINFKCHDRVHGNDCHTSNCPLTITMNGNKSFEVEKLVKGKDGKEMTCLVTAAPYFDANGSLIGIIEGFRDISDRKIMEERLREISITDEMTGLLNRRGFLDVAMRQLELAKRLDKSVFLLYTDIDDFKQINDTLGHAVGDEAIKETAELLCATFREADIIGIGRLGGDEFSVMMFSEFETTSKHPVISRLEAKLRERNKTTSQPYQLSISTGLIQYDHANPQSIDELLTLADKKMYDCKQQRKKNQT